MYQSVRGFVVEARRQVYASVNAAIVEAYWKIGQAISEACGGSERAAYGQHVLEYISERLTAEFGKGFTVANLRNMRQFYAAFPKRNALRSELSWTSPTTRNCLNDLHELRETKRLMSKS